MDKLSKQAAVMVIAQCEPLKEVIVLLQAQTGLPLPDLLTVLMDFFDDARRAAIRVRQAEASLWN